jgi:hypothetical protein
MKAGGNGAFAGCPFVSHFRPLSWIPCWSHVGFTSSVITTNSTLKSRRGPLQWQLQPSAMAIRSFLLFTAN